MLTPKGRSMTIGSFAGIPVKIHWSFTLLLIFIGYIAYSENLPASQLGWFFAYVVLLFIFVILHEYGHALTAKFYGIRTRDIILSPIGGIARLERLPKNPVHELMVALAGPAVNVILAVFFLIYQVLFSSYIFPINEQIDFSNSQDFVGYLLIINIVLVVFNMIPAFPMDGGRVLRALITMILKDRLRATRWAVVIGQFLSLAFVYFGFTYESYILAFIGVFVFFTARMEYRQLKLRNAMESTTVSEVMRTQFTTLSPDDRLAKVFDEDSETNFLVEGQDGQTIGSLPHQFIVRAKKDHLNELTVGSYMSQSFGLISAHYSLAEAFESLNKNGWAIAQVIDEMGNKKGVIDRQLLLDFMRKNSK